MAKEKEIATQQEGQKRNILPIFRIEKASTAPVIDGILEDEVWKPPPLELGDWISYDPLYGETIQQRTQVWVSYDGRHLYFAFRCFDPEPSKIKTTVSRRDNMWKDDWVGLSLDSLGSGQGSYDMFVNPSGIQGDILTSSASGKKLSFDWVWDSAGKLDDQGYSVEMRLPLQSIRFKSGSEAHMGILFWRRVSRLGISVSWPDIPPGGQWVFGRHATLLFDNLRQPAMLEFIPSVTYSLNQSRATPHKWATPDSIGEAGLSMKWGITSSITLEGTINPDFSQVESDAFQIEVNRRFPIFFSEKRPFFMEGMGIFDLAGALGRDSNMRAAVHTRRIADPSFGLKASGTVGRLTFGILSASDEAPGRVFNATEANPYLGKNKSFNVARVRFSLGASQHVGAIFTDTEFARGHNRVAGGDLSFRLGQQQQLSGAVLQSGVVSPDGGVSKSGLAAQTLYVYNTKRLEVFSQFEHFDQDFQMDTAFYNRTGITNAWLYMGVSFYPDKEKHPWLKRVIPLFYTQYGHDQAAGGNESLALLGLMLRFTRQGFLRIDYGKGKEPWAGRIFRRDATRIMGGAQLTKWLNIASWSRLGYAVFYDPSNPFQGESRSHSFRVSLQPNTKISQGISLQHVGFRRAVSGEPVFSVNIWDSRTTYQFNAHFFLRAILRIDSARKRALTDFLASYELVPGTVVYAGYGSLIEKRTWSNNAWLDGEGDYLTTKRGFFFKASYRWQ
ncbi:carbohydrate binding family 9 domain-containing protein [Acidobacteria bacterium AH-259-O06]|nr:carbohydrate binding family 9 domain-containing protein [Acidobacteria bacterium AH-259-O06]